MMEYKQMHYMFVIKSIAGFFTSTLVPFLIFLLFTQENGSDTLLAIYFSLLVLVIFFATIKWTFTAYDISDDQLKVKSGWLHKNFTVYPVETIQGINLTSNFIYRWVGVVHLKVETAGVADGSSVELIVTQAEARRIQEAIYPEAVEDGGSHDTTKSLQLGELLLMSSTSTGVLIGLPIIYGLYFQLQEIFPETMERLLHENSLLNSYRILTEGVTLAGIGWFALLVLTLLGIAWFLGTISTIFKYKDFTLTRVEDKIHIEHGFFVTKRVTIPVQRIQALKVVEGLLRQPFGLAAIKVESIGYGEESGGEAILLPLIKKKEVSQFLQEFVPEFTFEEGLINAPVQSLKYYLIRETLMFAFLILALWYVFDYGYLFAWLYPFAILLAVLKHKDAGILKTEEILHLRHRKFSKETILILNRSIQSLDIRQRQLRKKEGLSHYDVSIASEQQSKSFVVRDLPVSTYEELKVWLFLSQGQKFK